MLIPEEWTVPLVAMSLGCGLAEADEFVTENEDDLLAAVQREAMTREFNRIADFYRFRPDSRKKTRARRS